jgi:endo-1,4-beta-D-glucanase Y
MNEKDTFDALWKYVQKHLDSTGLMNWHIDSSGQTAGANSATDGDEDMAFALIQADKQWGGYTSTAKAFVGLIAKNDFETDGTVKGGDKYSAVNPSYLAPSYYRTFAKYTGDMVWMTILEKSYALLAAATNGTTGLVPDWSSPAGRGPDYKYDAARTPFRIGLDACQNGEPRAAKFSEGVAKFFAGIGVKNIKDGYNVSSGAVLDGSVSTNATFIGPAGVAGMAAKQQSFVNDAYAFVAGNDNEGTESYYNLSWALLTTLVMTGNFVDLTAL